MKINNLRKILHQIKLRKLVKSATFCISILFIISTLSVFLPTTVQAATPTLPFTDNFANLNAWTIVDGTWTIITNGVRGSSSTEALIYSGSKTWANYQITTQATIPAGGEASVVFRLADSHNYYWAGIGCWQHQYSISKVVGGKYAEIISSGTATSNNVGTYTLQVIAQGNIITLKVNGVSVLTTADTTFASGAIGLRTYGTNIQVGTLSAAVPTPSPTQPPTQTPTSTLSPTATPSPTSTPTPTPTPIDTYSYTMRVSGSNYQILNSANSIIKSSTSSSTTFNYLLGQFGISSSGNTIYVSAGTYSVDSSWFIYVSDITITFAPGATLKLANNINYPVIYLINCNGCTINNVSIDGNAANQAIGNIYSPNPNNGILIQDSTNCLVNGATITNARLFGVSIAGGSNNGVTNSVFTYCSWNGIQLGNGGETGLYAANNEIAHSSDVGITSWGYNAIITGNYIHNIDGTTGFNNAHWGIALESGGGKGNGNYCLIAQNTITSTSSGIAVTSSGNGNINYVLISGNTITNSGTCGIEIVNSNYDIIEYNTITKAYLGVYLSHDGTETNNNVYGNTYSGCTYNSVNHGVGTTTTATSIVALTVTSSPVKTGYITVNSNTPSYLPYTFYATVGTSITIVATNPSEYTFRSWSDSGAQSHAITVPSSNTIYRATYY